MVGFLLTALLLIATPVYAADDHIVPGTDLGRVASGLFAEATPEKFLHGLLDQALATLQEYVEVEGSLPSQESRRAGEFHLKLFPQGKSHSQEHVTAEGSFNLSPDSDQEFTLRFKASKPPQRSAPLPGDIL
jgi:hypothetical protein